MKVSSHHGSDGLKQPLTKTIGEQSLIFIKLKFDELTKVISSYDRTVVAGNCLRIPQSPTFALILTLVETRCRAKLLQILLIPDHTAYV